MTMFSSMGKCLQCVCVPWAWVLAAVGWLGLAALGKLCLQRDPVLPGFCGLPGVWGTPHLVPWLYWG